MAATLAALLVCSLAVSSLFYASDAADPVPVTSNFIRASCKVTQYPAVCVQSLSGYAATIRRSPRQLTQTALSVSLDRAQSLRAFVSKLAKFKGLKSREYEAVKDCLEEIGDTVDRIGQSVRELKKGGNRQEFQWHMSNVETWVSAALTDENTCTDGFSGRILNGRIKNSMRIRVNNLAQVTSNALALINEFAAAMH